MRFARFWRWMAGTAGVLMLLSSGAIAQSHFGSTTLGSGESATLTGNTGGGSSLPQTIAERDRDGNICIGYGTSMPDHILELQDNMPSLTLRLDTGGNDTTLIVRGPGGIRCGDDIARNNRDDEISGRDWSAGRYEIWVGTSAPRTRLNYSIRVTP